MNVTLNCEINFTARELFSFIFQMLLRKQRWNVTLNRYRNSNAIQTLNDCKNALFYFILIRLAFAVWENFYLMWDLKIEIRERKKVLSVHLVSWDFYLRAKIVSLHLPDLNKKIIGFISSSRFLRFLLES
jgi:hypothetical protein